MNQDQRELLELAAYAIGFQFNPTVTFDPFALYGCYKTDARQEEYRWSPLTNKADAFDLMVKLRLLDLPDILFTENLALNEGNESEVVMLAITRAAAVIGKQMKERGE